jgi:hypothetical protein
VPEAEARSRIAIGRRLSTPALQRQYRQYSSIQPIMNAKPTTAEPRMMRSGMNA